MAPPPPPLFLARASYRQRRLRDAIWLLPMAGAVLFSLPLLWSRGPEGPGTAHVLIYIFAVWALLILTAALLTAKLRPDETDAGIGSDPKAGPEDP